MKIKLIDDPMICPGCNARMTGLGLRDRQCNSNGMQCSLESDETRRTGEQIRLLMSRDAVLREIRPTEIGGSQW